MIKKSIIEIEKGREVVEKNLLSFAELDRLSQTVNLIRTCLDDKSNNTMKIAQLEDVRESVVTV